MFDLPYWSYSLSDWQWQLHRYDLTWLEKGVWYSGPPTYLTTILLDKLHAMGVADVNVGWFRSYHCDRWQLVCVNGVNSELCPFICGVPQVSILGPLLSLAYVNNIKSSVRANYCYRQMTLPFSNLQRALLKLKINLPNNSISSLSGS